MGEKVHPEHSFVFEVYIHRSNRNMIAIIVIRPNIGESFLSLS
jgi:hypothetical protein